MLIAAHHGNRLHAPESSLTAFLSGYCCGADVLHATVRLTQDGQVVLSRDPTVDRLTGSAGRLSEMTMADLRRLDFSETFRPPDSPAFRYYHRESRRSPILGLTDFLEALPDDVQLILELPDDATDMDRLVRATLGTLLDRSIISRVVVVSRDTEALDLARRGAADLRVAVEAPHMTPAQQVQLLAERRADGLVTRPSAFLAPASSDRPSELHRLLAERHASTPFRLGALVVPESDPPDADLREDELRRLSLDPLVWSASTASVLRACATARRSVTLVDESFAGPLLDTERFSLGYAKANPYCVVSVADGIHVDIRDYDKPLPTTSSNPAEQRLRDIEELLVSTAKVWPYYSGGGVGVRQGIRGDFAAEVDYTAATMQQATTLEMAVLNVDPGSHQPAPPTSFRNKDSFYDPHGAPPYVGVEHDEDDGFRINWNLGSEYDNNQYGRPAGDGKTARAARLRLERRGPYFAAYYRNEVDARTWACVGVTRNDSMNPVVYLRCVGKRWRQEVEDDPGQYHQPPQNHFVFRNLSIVRFPSMERSQS